MSIRDFNREYSTIGVGKCNLSADEAMQLHCLMVRTICNLNTSELNENDMEVVTMLSNIHEIILKSSHNSAVIRECVDTLNKTVTAIPNKQFVLNRLRVLPIMTDLLEISPQLNTTELILKMLHGITFGVEITIVEPFLEKLMRIVVDIIVDQNDPKLTFDEQAPNEALRKAAVSVLINICSNNMAMLSLLSQKVNFVDFQKQVSIDRYGILACKTNLMLNDCGHLLTDADIRNFLMFASKETLRCMKNQDESTLKHLIGFVRDIASRPNTKHVLREYNFLADFEAAIMLLDNQDDESYSTQISALFELSSIILETKNRSLANMRLTILNFAQRHIKTRNCCVKALKTLIAIFEFDKRDDHVSTNNFELTELKQSLMDILTGNDFEPYIMIPVLKLLIVLGLKYRVEILNNVVVVAVLRPLIDDKKIVYSKLLKENVTMYLQCLVTMLKLSHIHTTELNMSLLSTYNVRYVVAMALKIGNLEQRVLALELMSSPTYFPPNVIAELMAETLFEYTEVAPGETTVQCMPPPLMSSTMISNNVRTPLMSSTMISNTVRDSAGDDDSGKLIARIQKACDENKLNKVPVGDFIKLYEDRLITQNQQIAVMERKLSEMSKDITHEKHTSLRVETSMLRWTEMAKSLQGSNELLTRDKQSLSKTIVHLKEELNEAKETIKQHKKTYAKLESSIKDLKDANMKTVYELQTTIKNKTLEIEALNEKLKESDNIANTVVSLFSKRKK